MKKYFPILNWLPNYKKEYLTGDITAGLTVGVMLIPQGMAYAMIAGLPPVYGLYAAILPQLVYAIFGTSRQLAVGAVAMDSLLVAAGVSVIATAGTENYIALAVLLAFMVGVIQLALGIFKMGFLVNFLSKPVISGFTSAAAFIIGINQLTHLLGIDIERNTNIFPILKTATLHISKIHWLSLAIGIASVLLLIIVKRVNKSIPGALIIVIIGILLVKYLALDAQGVNIVGEVPKGLPSFAFPAIGSSHFNELIPFAFTLALIAFMEAISVAKALQMKHKKEYKLDANQEFIGLGLGNIAGSFFSSFPTSGGFGRSAINDQAGAKTNLAAIISAGLVALTLLFLTPLFFYLPKGVLAAIIVVAVWGLVDVSFPLILWKTKKEDFLMLTIAFCVTLGLGIKEGIIASVAMSLVAMIYRSTKPHFAVLGKMPNSNEYRNIKRFENLEINKEVLVIRYDADLYFANTNHFIESITQKVDSKGSALKLLVLHAGSISHIDSTAFQALTDLIEDLDSQGITLYFSHMIGPTRDFLKRSGLLKMDSGRNSFLDIESAIAAFKNER